MTTYTRLAPYHRVAAQAAQRDHLEGSLPAVPHQLPVTARVQRLQLIQDGLLRSLLLV